jgi:hypothetical protein
VDEWESDHAAILEHLNIIKALRSDNSERLWLPARAM